MQIQLFFTRKVLHLASLVLKVRGFRTQKSRVLIHLIAWCIAGRIGMTGRVLFHAVTVLQHSSELKQQDGKEKKTANLV